MKNLSLFDNILAVNAKSVKTLVKSLGLVAFLVMVTEIVKADEVLPAGWESYLERPDILQLDAQAIPNLDSKWEKLKKAHFSFVAELLAVYPSDTHIYFLARDSEHLYDVAKLVTKDTETARRIHLLNISRINVDHPNMRQYLAENGISEQTLSLGKKILFVDTGFSGTISKKISDSFPKNIRYKLKTHLVVSNNIRHPSSRVFLIHLNPEINKYSPALLHNEIGVYEHIPRYMDRSSKFVSINGKQHPISQINGAVDGSVSKEKSLELMKDLVAEWSRPEIKIEFRAELKQLQQLKALLSNPQNVEQIRRKLEALKESDKGNMLEAQIRDIISSANNATNEIKINLKDLGLGFSSRTEINKKPMLIKKNPELAKYLKKPDSEIPKLFLKKNWQIIKILIDADVNYQINKVLLNQLYSLDTNGVAGDLQKAIIENGDSATLRDLTSGTFSQELTRDKAELLKLLIDKADLEVLRSLAEYTFSKEHTKDKVDMLKLLIEKADVAVLDTLATYTFSQEHTRGKSFDILRKAIEIKDLEKRTKFLADNYKVDNSLNQMAEIVSNLKSKDRVKTSNQSYKKVSNKCEVLFLN